MVVRCLVLLGVARFARSVALVFWGVLRGPGKITQAPTHRIYPHKRAPLLLLKTLHFC